MCGKIAVKVERERTKVGEFVQQSMMCDKRCEMLVGVEKNAFLGNGLPL